MAMTVDQKLCAGCGDCIDACSAGAIHLEDRIAVIDDDLCTQCEACVDACPNGAITVIDEPVRRASIIPVPETEAQIVPGSPQARLPEMAAPAQGTAPVAGAVLAFLGSEVAPRLLDLLMSTLERRLAQPATSQITPVSTSVPTPARGNKGKRKQARYRGGRAGNGNRRGRR